MYEYILFVLYIQITLEWPCMTSRIGRGFKQFMDSDSGTSKTYPWIFLDFFEGFLSTWPWNDLEPDVMKLNQPAHRNQRPKKPTGTSPLPEYPFRSNVDLCYLFFSIQLIFYFFSTILKRQSLVKIFLRIFHIIFQNFYIIL